jgi:hypothetical protein
MNGRAIVVAGAMPGGGGVSRNAVNPSMGARENGPHRERLSDDVEIAGANIPVCDDPRLEDAGVADREAGAGNASPTRHGPSETFVAFMNNLHLLEASGATTTSRPQPGVALWRK